MKLNSQDMRSMSITRITKYCQLGCLNQIFGSLCELLDTKPEHISSCFHVIIIFVKYYPLSLVYIS